MADFIGHGTSIKGIYNKKEIDCGVLKFKKFVCRDNKKKQLNCKACLEEGEEVTLFVRPDEVRLEELEPVRDSKADITIGKVVSKKFRGSNYLYGVEINPADGSMGEPVVLWSSMSSLFDKQIGEKVRMRVVSETVSFFREEEER